MRKTFKVISPIDNHVYVEIERHDDTDIENAVQNAVNAQASWKKTPLVDRISIVKQFAEAIEKDSEGISEELCWQMGRPITQAPGEVNGTVERTLGMVDLAETALADVAVAEKPGFTRYIKREPLGVVLVVPAWNYPYLIAVNSIVPALL
ncbi:MAG: aldehyde dehydrogenase family protein, partial [Calditrichaeota bacterium]